VIRGWLGTATAIGQSAKLVALAFAVVAAVGGLVKVAGGATWLAIVVAALGVAGTVIALGFGAAEVGAQRREARAALWRRAPCAITVALANDGMYAVGVDKEASEALRIAGVTGRHAPYVWREVDEALRARLCGAAKERQTTLIVLRGPSKAGKSRTVLEALQAVCRGVLGWRAGRRDVDRAGERGRLGPPGVGATSA
jgi:hypothetical protein